jgi:anti-sigma regulatory factor (Ser/Thr protein kinase)
MERASGVEERVGPSREGTSSVSASRPFSHQAFLHAGDEEFASGAASFVMDALDADEAVLVAVRREREAMLRHALGASAQRVMFSDVVTLGRNPARLMPAWVRFLEEHAGEGRGVAVLAESVWAGRTRAELSECLRYESLLNSALAGGRGWRLVCAYDVDALDTDAIELARSTHPLLRRDRGTEASRAYAGADALRPLEGVLPEPPADAKAMAFSLTTLHELRQFVSEVAHASHLSSERTENLRLAVNELASNSVRHGGGAGTLTTWQQDGTLVCQVSDGGHIRERLVGRVRPDPDQASGRGLWLVNHLCDLVQVRSDAHGTVVRVHMRLDEEAARAGA